ncbi:MAG: rane protein [Acidimicrobiaceae bacterium]|nr:rane protein [Acidimicrobiaceae bacterium]
MKKHALVAAVLAIGAIVTLRRPRPAPPPNFSTAAGEVEKMDGAVDNQRGERGERGTRAANERPGGIKGRLWDVGQRFRPFGVALRMNDRFSELNGNFLAGAVTLQSFLSLFPLLLVVLAVAGFVTANKNPNLGVEIIGHLGLSGSAAKTFSDALDAATDARRTTLGIGTVGLLWSGLGLVGALQYAYNQVWQVQSRGIKDKLVGAAWLLGAALLFLGTAVLTAVLGLLPGFLWPISIVFTLATNVVLWLWTAKLLPNRDVGWRPLLPGAILGGVGLEILKIVGRFYVPHLIASASAVYGSIGIVFAVLAWLFFFGRLIVYSACLNVVLWEERAGTIKATIEVPATDEASAEVRRSGQANDPDDADDADAPAPATDPGPDNAPDRQSTAAV